MQEIETFYVKASQTASQVVWRLLNSTFAGDDEEDCLSFKDKEILEDILRYGSIAELAKRSGRSCFIIKKQIEQALGRLDMKIKSLDYKLAHLKKMNQQEATASCRLDFYMKKAQRLEREMANNTRLLDLEKANEKLRAELECVRGENELLWSVFETK